VEQVEVFGWKSSDQACHLLVDHRLHLGRLLQIYGPPPSAAPTHTHAHLCPHSQRLAAKTTIDGEEAFV
jgi:hypothetical protein